MNRTKLVEAIAKELGFTKAHTDRFVDAFIETVTMNNKTKEGVRLVGFGTFLTAKRKARVGRNPRTGQPLKIPARVISRFRPGSALKDAAR